ncbi:type II toxin-antitoxin system VapC family toxin [Algoriphagus yeomjeoni]|uniref:PIN domain-containing protein n=1 Tax=Algoriphagus yeomjeoni TaxID=291403 RepID=A0A327PRD2_9BACT|nr:type II toxin-antitoxin system VapC family toxin [Algoriphagus yeomjeoni]RAI94935.1 hypothetical protein LV83_00183 [Algoriphagus yeomjeoni]
MNGNSLLLDTNIILYLLSGDQTIADFLNNKSIFISFVTELELLGYNDLTTKGRQIVENLLEDSAIIDINSEIKKLVIELRNSNKIKLPDAIIAATAFYLNIPLMTADKRLSKVKELNILLFEK